MTKKPPLYLAFLWHMHQPFYKDLKSEDYILPWVRLHAIKDYYDMGAILREYPHLRQTFNFVPSLFVQLEDYAHQKAKDIFLTLTIKKAAELSAEEKVFILKNFFFANREHMIAPYPRYAMLLDKREQYGGLSNLGEAHSYFSVQDYLDLQMWFNLAWSGNTLMANPEVKKLVGKGRNFSEADKQLLISKQTDLLGKIIPLFKGLLERGQIEISTTPFYHPILPLLCNTELARISDPRTPLPEEEFKFPRDAQAQVHAAREYYERVFGQPPDGMWPAEGSVAEEIIPIVASEGIKWIATDEDILKRSHTQSDALRLADFCRPSTVFKEGKQISIFFRNRYLSDRIGFVYSKWNGTDAAQDFVNELSGIRRALPDSDGRYVVSIILDGENAWEHYPRNGKDFFDSLYTLLSQTQSIVTTTFTDFLRNEHQGRVLTRLHPGSWIDANFRTWIGHPEKNKAWEYLSRTRRFIEESGNKAASGNLPQDDRLKKAWESFYVAEGSDWFWWYGDDHYSENSAEFDALFRQHLKNVYYFIGSTPPLYLSQPIKVPSSAVWVAKTPTQLISPTIDGIITNYYEWSFAGCYKVTGSHGAMHQSEKLVEAIYFGYDRQNIYLRVDPTFNLSQKYGPGITFVFSFTKPLSDSLTIKRSRDNKYEAQWMGNSSGETAGSSVSFAVNRIIEIAIPIAKMRLKEGDEIQMRLIVKEGAQELEQWPSNGALSFVFSPSILEEVNWIV